MNDEERCEAGLEVGLAEKDVTEANETLLSDFWLPFSPIRVNWKIWKCIFDNERLINTKVVILGGTLFHILMEECLYDSKK